ncbi:MAG: FAD-dependent oxidoreductase [SAR86 cluster bacterium]|nr:FAD-dependent oxidoreductase [SAR86 cluster bacterium]
MTVKSSYSYDVIIIGSGNGGMTAAISAHDQGLNVLIIEKSRLFGGSSATSGGGVWVPNNRYAKELEANDSLEEARTYIKHVSPKEKISDDLIETYLIKGPEMIDYLHENTHVKYISLEHYPDYFPDDPGGKSGHRSMEPEPFYGDLLREDLKFLRGQHPQTKGPMGINFTQVEGQILLGGLSGWVILFIKLLIKFLFDFPYRFTNFKDRRLTMGNAGIARLRMSLKEREVPFWLNTSFKEFVFEGGKVTGIKAIKEGDEVTISARHGVVLASGGFERNQEMRDKFLPKPSKTSWSAANLDNTGEVITEAIKIGGKTNQMESAWWSTVMQVPGEEKARLSMVDKSLPGAFCVNSNGERFSNESQNYVSFVDEMYDKFSVGNPCIPCFMIFDSEYRKKRPCGPLLQSSMMPDSLVPNHWWDNSFLVKANSLEELADKLSINKDGFMKTINKVNTFAAEGKDLDYKRGDSVYDRYYGDPSIKPNPCLGTVSKPPFYSITLYPGEMGTAGGLVIDSRARVLDSNNLHIPGLWACGNCTSALLPRYPGPGSTLGPAMTFGYIAGRDIGRAN